MTLAFVPFDLTSHVDITYRLLQNRKHKISHNDDVSYDKHKDFCASHPYEAWYLVYFNDQAVGSFYLTSANAIGINLLKQKSDWYKAILDFVLEHHQPKMEKPSEIPNYFYINVPASNKLLSEFLEKQGKQLIQYTFKV